MRNIWIEINLVVEDLKKVCVYGISFLILCLLIWLCKFNLRNYRMMKNLIKKLNYLLMMYLCWVYWKNFVKELGNWFYCIWLNLEILWWLFMIKWNIILLRKKWRFIDLCMIMICLWIRMIRWFLYGLIMIFLYFLRD